MPKTTLYSCEGEVLSIPEAVTRLGPLVSEEELSMIEKNLYKITTKDVPDIIYQQALTRSKRLGSEKVLEVSTSGKRSAYWNDEKIKFKGCNPKEKKRSSLYFDFEKQEEKSELEPWGTLRGKDVIREILGIISLEENGIRNILRPVAVYKYTENRFCLIEECKTNRRAPELYEGHTVLGSEFGFKDPLSLEKYNCQVTDILTNMHVKGLFRGATDGHPENVLVDDDGKVYLCDFCNFELGIPEKPEIFFMKALTEAIEASPIIFSPIIKVVIGNKLDEKQLENVFRIYMDRSTFYQEYTDKLLNKVSEMSQKFDKLSIKKGLKSAENSFLVKICCFSSIPTNIKTLF